MALGIAMAMLIAVPFVLAQSTSHDHGAQATAPATSASTPQQQAMTTQMMAVMQAKQQHLDQMVAQMNAATGQAKVDQMAAVVTELATMHRDMLSMMTMMHGGTMHHDTTPGGTAPDAAPGGGHQHTPAP
jgi:monomeric isocitrate dehydrogenase